jgi:hypothetical protein
MNLSGILESDDQRRLLAIASKCCIEGSRFRWYDANFLRLFEATKRYLELVLPNRVAEFASAFDVLRTDPEFRVRHLDTVFDPQTFEEVRETLHSLPYVALSHYESGSFGRSLLRHHPVFTRLQSSLTARVSELVGEPVSPSYNFLALYRSLGRCDPHLDEPISKWTLDICIEQSVEWPIFVSQVVDWPTEARGAATTIEDLRSDPSLSFDPIVLTPNRGVIFSGSSQWHYREPIAGKRSDYCHLLFFHYLPEGAGPLADPKQWPEYFDIPELEILLAADALLIAKQKDREAADALG